MRSPPFKALGRHVAQQQDAALETALPDEKMRQRLAVLASARRRSRSRRAGWRPGFLAAAAGAALLIALLLWITARPSTLTYTIGLEAQPGRPGEWVDATRMPASIRFSDGTEFKLEPRGRARVTRIGPHGAELVLGSGRAWVDVVKREDAEWWVVSGPFRVRVHGTRFAVQWDPREDQFALQLFEGSVSISGCGFEQQQTLRAGQEVRASCSRQEMIVTALGDGQAPPRDPASSAAAEMPDGPRQPTAAAAERHDGPRQPTAALATASPAERHGAEASNAAAPGLAANSRPPRTRAVTPRPPESTVPSAPDWLRLARGGHYAAAYDTASALGFDRLGAARPASEVLLLGAAALHAGHPAEARRAYAAVRARFPGTDAAAAAAFSLGRLYADMFAEPAASTRWFRTYLRERPGGALAQVALGRILEAKLRTGGAAGARATALAYLERYPSGPHADEARKVARATE